MVNWKLLCRRINSGKHDNTHSFQFWSKPFLSLVSFSYFTMPSLNPCQVIFQVLAMLNLLLVHPCRTIANVITHNEARDRAHMENQGPREMHHLLDTSSFHYSRTASHKIKLVLGLPTIQSYYSQQDSQNVSGVCKTLFPHTRWKN